MKYGETFYGHHISCSEVKYNLYILPLETNNKETKEKIESY